MLKSPKILLKLKIKINTLIKYIQHLRTKQSITRNQIKINIS